MPIKPENRALYPFYHWAEPLDALLLVDERIAIESLRSLLMVDVLRDSNFWEALIARLIGGELTPKLCPWDVEIPGHEVRVEVKFSSEFMCSFAAGQRPVFRFSFPRGTGAQAKPCTALVLVGVDALGNVNSWVLPPAAVKKCRSITLTSPRARMGGGFRDGMPMDRFICPPSQILPEVLRAGRVAATYEKHQQHHNETAYATRMAKRGNLELPL